MTHFFARKGDEIRDHSGSLFATVARDLSVYQDSLPKASDFVFSGSPLRDGDVMPEFMFTWLTQRRNAVVANLPKRDAQFQRWQVV